MWEREPESDGRKVKNRKVKKKRGRTITTRKEGRRIWKQRNEEKEGGRFPGSAEREVPHRLGTRAEAVGVPEWFKSPGRNPAGGGSYQRKSYDVQETLCVKQRRMGWELLLDTVGEIGRPFMPLIYYHYICVKDPLCWQSVKNPASWHSFLKCLTQILKDFYYYQRRFWLLHKLRMFLNFKRSDISYFNKTRNYETEGSPPQNVVKCMPLPQPSMAGAVFVFLCSNIPSPPLLSGWMSWGFGNRLKKKLKIKNLSLFCRRHSFLMLLKIFEMP